MPPRRRDKPKVSTLDEYERGVIVGLIVGEGSFSPNGRCPQLIIGMHVRHEHLLRWLHARLPGSRLNGPYHHDGRGFFRLHLRGRAFMGFLPEVEDEIRSLCPHATQRLDRMLVMTDE